jgi:hypothetical protein
METRQLWFVFTIPLIHFEIDWYVGLQYRVHVQTGVNCIYFMDSQCRRYLPCQLSWEFICGIQTASTFPSGEMSVLSNYAAKFATQFHHTAIGVVFHPTHWTRFEFNTKSVQHMSVALPVCSDVLVAIFHIIIPEGSQQSYPGMSCAQSVIFPLSFLRSKMHTFYWCLHFMKLLFPYV